MPAPDEPVVVIGAGPAGLACGERLLAAGVPCLLLEARDRVGGRTLTDYSLAPGFPVELGAQMIHGRHVVTHRWAAALGLSTTPWPILQRSRMVVEGRAAAFPWFAFPLYPRFGTRAFLRGVRTIPRELMAHRPPDESLASFLARRPPPEGARRIVEILHAHAYAADADQIGVDGPAEEARAASERFGYRNFRLEGGYSELFRRRADPWKDRIRLGTRATRIRVANDHLRVETESGPDASPATWAASRVVVTVPLGVLQHRAIEFDPPLPASKQRAIDRLAFGTGYALQLRLAGGNLRERLGNFSVVWGGGASSFHRPALGRPGLPEILTSFTVGREAGRRSLMSEAERLEATLAELRSILPSGADPGRVGAASVHLWPLDPYSRGAYSFLPVGVGLDARRELAAPVDGRLFFAGEATHTAGESTTVHGAIETGYRAADEVLRSLRTGPAVAGESAGRTAGPSVPRFHPALPSE